MSIQESRLYKQTKMAFLLSIISQPFEVMRTSSITMANDKPKGLVGLVKYIFGSSGIYGMFKGCSVSILRNIVSVTVFYAGVDYQRKHTANLELGAIGNFISGGAIKSVSTLVASPLNVLKTRVEAFSETKVYAFPEMKKIWVEEGIKGFFKGFFPTLMRDIPFSGLQYSIYTAMNSFTSKRSIGNDSKVIGFVNGGISSALAIILTYPFDNIRVRQQFSHNEAKLWPTVQEVYAKEGFKGFFVGCTPRLLRKVATGSIMWGLYEGISKNDKKSKF